MMLGSCSLPMRRFLLALAVLGRHFCSSGAANAALNGRKISVVSALLPTRPDSDGSDRQRGAGARLRIEAFGGCYHWTSQRPDLLSVEAPEPLEPRAEALECMERKAFECMDRGPILPQELFGAKEEVLPGQEAGASCQAVAILRSVAQNAEGTQKVLVFARDLNDPTIELRCEVYLSRVARVAVETTARRINVDDRETLMAKAYDRQGNVFSSLEGLEFEWHIGDQGVLRSPPLVDTAFKLSPARRALAQMGAQSDMLLVRGVTTGQTSVVVKLLSSGAERLQSPEIELTVKENILIVPSVVRVPPMADLQLRLKILRGQSQSVESLDAVPLPVSHFRWSQQALDGGDDVLFVPGHTGRVIAQSPGSAYAVVRDERISNNTDSALIHVVEPAALRVVSGLLGKAAEVEWEEAQRWGMDVELHHRSMPWPTGWYFVRGNKYILKLEMLDSASQALFMPPNFRVGLSCLAGGESAGQPCPFRTVRQTENSVMVMIEAHALGAGTIIYKNVSVTEDVRDSKRGKWNWADLSVRQKFHVVDPVQLRAPFAGPLVLPPGHSLTLDVVGGSGAYTFTLVSSTPAGACSISASGLVQATSELGNAELLIADARNAANSISLKVLVRQVGHVFLRPPYLQLQLPSAGDSSEGVGKGKIPVPIFARPEALRGDDDASWGQLRFWNCSAIPAVFSAATSSPEILSVEMASPKDVQAAGAGACNVIYAMPRAAGDVTLTTASQIARIHGKDVQLEASVKLHVYAPLALRSGEGAGELGEMRIAPCSSASLSLLHGPSAMTAPGRVFQNLSAALEDTHVRLLSVGPRAFEVLCLRPTPGRVQVFAEVRQEPNDPDAHGGSVVARASVWIVCAVPTASYVVPLRAADGVLPARPRSNGTLFGLRQGQAHHFSTRFADADGQPILNASAYRSNWVIDGKDAQHWLAVDASRLAVISVPSDPQSLGASVSLAVKSSVPDIKQCIAGHALQGKQASALQSGLEGVTPPAPDVLHLRVTSDFTVRWSGYPSRHFAFAPDWAFAFEAGHGSGVARLSLNESDPVIAAVVETSALCRRDVTADSGGCFKVAPASPSMSGATTWFLHPSSPGYVQVVVEDTNQLGVVPAAIDVSFLPVSRIRLALSEVDTELESQTSTLLITRGRRYSLSIEMWDTAGQPLSSANWDPLRLHVDASDPRLMVEWMPEQGIYSVIGKALGVFEIQADVRNHPNAVVYSNKLRVHVFEKFGIAPARAVVLPDQTFEFALHGGPAAGASETAHVEFTSSKETVAVVRRSSANDGLAVGLAVGSTTISARLVESGTGRELALVSADVVVAIPDKVSITFMESSAHSHAEASAPTLLRGSQAPLRLVASLSSGDVSLTTSLLTAPMGSVGEPAGASHSCRFTWSIDDPSIELVPVGFSSYLGAVAVDVLASASTSAATIAESTISVIVECPKGRRLAGQLRLPVVQPLQLVAPVTDGSDSSARGARLLSIPPHARVPLVFSQASEHLQISLLDGGAGAGVRPVAELQDHGQAVELVAGPAEGEVLAVVRDQRAGSQVPPLMVTVAVRVPHSLRLTPALPDKLALHASAEVRVHLVDASGAPIVLSSSALVSHSVSHPSVLVSQLTQTAEGGTFLKLHAIKEGCASVSVSTDVPGYVGDSHEASSKLVLADAVLVCVSPGALVGRHQHLLVLPGAAVHLGVDMAAMAARTVPLEEELLAFSIRLALAVEDAAPLDQISKQLADDLSTLLKLRHESVAISEARWVPHGGVRLCARAVFDADVRIRSRDLPAGTDLPELAERLWSHPELRSSVPLLRFLDLGHGVRAPLQSLSTSAAGSSRSHGFTAHSSCSGGRGLSSSSPQALVVGEDGEATASRAGEAIAQICFGAVSAEADIVVTSVGLIRTEALPSGVLLGTSGDDSVPRVSNIVGETPLVVLLRFFTRQDMELLSGPFHSQNVQFDCQPTDAALNDFFTFETWNAFNLVSEVPNTLLQLPWGPGSAQSACIVVPKALDARNWGKVAAPAVLSLQVSVHGQGGSALDAGVGAATAVEWPFVPQFVALDDKGRQFSAGENCGILSLAQPTATFWVWTGGHPVEVALGQLRKPQRGVLAVHVSEPADAPATPPTISVTVVWDASAPFGEVEEVELRLESRVSAQVQVLKVRVDGSPWGEHETSPSAVLPGRTSPSFFGSFQLPQALLLCVVIVCSGCCFCRLCNRGFFDSQGPSQVPTSMPRGAGGMWAGYGAQAPAAYQPAPASTLHGHLAAGQGQGPSPFKRVDLRPY